MVTEYRQRGIPLTSRIERTSSAKREDGTRSVLERFYTPDGLTAAVVQYFIDDAGEVARSGQKDPKRVVFDGVDYREAPKIDE